VLEAYHSWTHPPLTLRKQLLQMHPVLPTKLTLQSEESERLIHEFEPLDKEILEYLWQGKRT